MAQKSRLTYSPPYKGRDSSRFASWNYWFIEFTYHNLVAQIMPEMSLSPVFYSISRACFPMPLGTVKTLLIGSLVLGVQYFYPQKHYSVERPSISFQGTAYRLDTRFFKRLITLASVLNYTMNAIINQYKAGLKPQGFKPSFPVN